MKITYLAGLLLAISCQIQAAPYINGGIGYTRWHAQGDFIGAENKLFFSDRDFSMVFNAGYKFSSYIGVEAGYRAYSNNPIAYLSFNEPFDHLGQNMTAHGSALSLIGYIPLGDNFSFAVKIGGLRWIADIKPSSDHGSDHFSGTDPVYGLSAKIKSGKSYSIDYNYEVTQFENINSKLIYMGISYYF